LHCRPCVSAKNNLAYPSFEIDFEWHHSAWDFKNVIAAGADKVHLDVQFTRYRADNSAIGSYRSLWIVSKIDGHWSK
jgi:hypothetical protein